MEPRGYLVLELDLQGRMDSVVLQEDHEAVSGADAVPEVWNPSPSPGCSLPSADPTLLSLEASWRLPHSWALT